MALINCPDCGKEVSDRAAKCIHCGCPINQSDESANSTEITVKKAYDIKEKIVASVKKIDKKVLIIVPVALVVIIIAAIAISGLSGGLPTLGAEEIELNETYTINDLGELEIIRAYTTNNLLESDANKKTHIVFECNFTNRTESTYAISKMATMTAESKETKATYTSCSIGTAYSYMSDVDAEPNIKTRVTFALEVSDNDGDLIVSLNFGDKSLDFKYTVGDLIRDNEEMSTGDTFDVKDVASVEITDIAYSNGVWASDPYYRHTHEGYAVDNDEETAFLILDTNYTNMKHYNQAPDDMVKLEAVYDDTYYYTQKKFYIMESNNERVSPYTWDNDFIPQSKVRVCMVLEVPKKMIEKEVEINLFIGDEEFTYNGTPKYTASYGMYK